MAKQPDEKPKLVQLDSYRSLDRCPPDLITSLEEILKMAKDGKLMELVLSYNYMDGELFEKTGMCPGAHGFFRADGRLDSLHSTAQILAHEAMMRVMEDDDEQG
jgi:hypothetical protein